MRGRRSSEDEILRVLAILFAVLLALFGLTLIRDSIGYLFEDSDWSEDYLRTEATIVSSRERKLGSDAPAQTTAARITPASYGCSYFVEFTHEGQTYRQVATWLTKINETERGADCGAARFGETIPVWLQEGYQDSPPKVREVGDRGEKPMTIGFLFLMGLAMLYGSFRLGRRTWRRWKARKTAE